ncbi:hypothetical protein [Paracoccus sp. NSM]|uniref:hypothetical protein n=1 Tax=Paracoccus sp. NSM TaxID=3457784 RepID=UPI004036EE86
MNKLTAFCAGLAGGALVAHLARREARSHDRPALRRAPGPVRDAGPAEMRDPPEGWSRADDLSDQSFPASDPPGTY